MMSKIEKSKLIYFLEHQSSASQNTKRCWNYAIQHLPDELVFKGADELYDQTTYRSTSSHYLTLSLLRAYVTYNESELSPDLVQTVYETYERVHQESKNAQLMNRHESRWTVETLLDKMRAIPMDSYNHMISKLLIAMYTLIPPLRQDYYNVKFNEHIDLDKGLIHVYSQKSQVVAQIKMPDELIDILRSSLVYMPRTLLFVRQNGKNWANQGSMYSSIVNILRRELSDPLFTINTFRHIYAQWSFKCPPTERIQIAHAMLHSPETHLTY